MADENLDELVARKSRYVTATWGRQYLEDAANHYTWQPESVCYPDLATGKEVWVLVHAPDRQDIYSPEHCSAAWSHNGSRINFLNANTRTTGNPAITNPRLWLVNTNGKCMRCCEGYEHNGVATLDTVGWANTEEAFYALGDTSGRILSKYVPDSNNVPTKTTVLDLSGVNLYEKEFVKLPVSGDDSYITLRDLTDHSCGTPNPINCTEVYFVHLAGTPHLELHWGVARKCGPDADPYGTHLQAEEGHFHDVWALGPGHTSILGQYSETGPLQPFWTFDRSGSYSDGGPVWSDYPFGQIRCETTRWGQTPQSPYSPPCPYFGHPAPDRWGRYALVGNTEEPQSQAGTQIWDYLNHTMLANWMAKNVYDGNHHSWTGWTDYIITMAGASTGVYCNKYTLTEASLYLVCNTHHPGYTGNYNGYPRPAQSPDGTKVAFAACWLNNSGDDYPYISFGVPYYPYPAEISGASIVVPGFVRIAWGSKKYTARGWPTDSDPAPEPREIAYRHVWISSDGATGWADLTAAGVAFGTNYLDYAQAPSTTRYYSVTSEEYCGLSSRRLGNVWKITLDGGGTITESVQYVAYPADPGGVSAFWTTKPAAPAVLTRVQQAVTTHYRVSWAENLDSKVRYYNLYYGEGVNPTIDVQHLVASIPAGIGTWLDWNVKSGVDPHYAMTTVDRYGNESDPIHSEQTKIAIGVRR